MYVSHLALADFRSYAQVEVALSPGVTTFVGLNGVGKTNLVEAVGYIASLSSHRVATDAPLVRHGADRAIIRASVVREGRESLAELEIVPGRANRARINRAPVTRPRDVLGVVRTVLFAPEDLALVKGDPMDRRRFLDDLLVQRQPRWAGVRLDYERVLKQRNALLRSAASVHKRRGGAATAGDDNGHLSVWDSHLADVGAHLLYARLRLLRDLAPLVSNAYDEVTVPGSGMAMSYRSSVARSVSDGLAEGEVPQIDELREILLTSMAEMSRAELERGHSLVGPHRDDLELRLGGLPAKGYASHGESWSVALAMKLAAYELLRRDVGSDPVLILDDVFAELDARRRDRLAGMVAGNEQVLITAAVMEDIPATLTGGLFEVSDGTVVAAPGAGATSEQSEWVGMEP